MFGMSAMSVTWRKVGHTFGMDAEGMLGAMRGSRANENKD